MPISRFIKLFPYITGAPPTSENTSAPQSPRGTTVRQEQYRKVLGRKTDVIGSRQYLLYDPTVVLSVRMHRKQGTLPDLNSDTVVNCEGTEDLNQCSPRRVGVYRSRVPVFFHSVVPYRMTSEGLRLCHPNPFADVFLAIL